MVGDHPGESFPEGKSSLALSTKSGVHLGRFRESGTPFITMFPSDEGQQGGGGTGNFNTFV